MKSISVIMPSYLTEYEGAAKSREMKFIRAVNSFYDNAYEHKKLVIVSDGCDLTNNLVNKYSKDWPGLVFVVAQKQDMFSGGVRQLGLNHADSDCIAYLDTDDTIGKNHLHNIVAQMEANNLDFCWFNDYVKTGYGTTSKQMRITKLEYGHCGTSTIAHRYKFRNGFIPSWGKFHGYGHDFEFIKEMEQNTIHHKKIFGCMYLVHHLKGTNIDF